MRRYGATALVAFILAAAAPAAFAEGKVLQRGQIPPSLGHCETIQGDPFTDLKGLKGRVVQIVFFASW